MIASPSVIFNMSNESIQVSTLLTIEGGIVSRLFTFEVGQVYFLSSLDPCIPTISLTEQLSNFQSHRY
jgi:hypothetical protein